MDLNEKMISVQTDFGQINGTEFDLVLFLRERAVTDLSLMLDVELSNTSESYTGTEGENDIDDELGYNEYYDEESTDEEEYAVDESEINDEQPKSSELIDTTITARLNKFSEVIKYLDEMIETDGVIVNAVEVEDIINKFKELDGLYEVYGEFEIYKQSA
ncbi:hypothetical protein [Staphylococcus xylosus]|uniref:hypothetical protein n=1 Tax=Staphylococcus xylosus TaxID=1288 RepID=UPI000D1D530C|nr:hypothetical protein [Staphylococcus xylosus]PTH96996.1 hypothetical protein BU099_12315 [Staphylococcus xylosus]